ncbi:mechanosensitive ion channel family protein [Rothia nasimurium]|uniref:mechanosensitive ion channel family protein n=1 Tax=Rothia nasimurium TaxID=85336 RepID=UPI001F19D6BA|nr:mechanosensitive ion channel family protein [Rothia nasimurium]
MTATGILAAETTPLEESAEAAGTIMARLASLDFWLGAPLRILIIIIIGIILHGLVRVVIRQVTDSIARGTKNRVVAADEKKGGLSSRWKADTSLASARQSQRAQTVGSVLRSISSIVIWTVMIVMIIAELGFNIAPVIASAGVVGVALSFGAQSLVKDFLSGIFIVAEDQLGIGDWVNLGEAEGEVEAVGLRTTQVRDTAGTLWHVRNGEILRVGNSSQGWARTIIDLPIPYDADIDEMANFLMTSIQKAIKLPGIKENISGKPQYLGVQSVTGESVILRLTVKTAPSEQFAVGRKLREELKKAMDQRGLRIPLANQSVIHNEVHEERPAPSGAKEQASSDEATPKKS